MCSLNETQYQCKCEGLFVWPNNTCHSYEACDVITDGSCTCINALPTDGQFCQGETSFYYNISSLHLIVLICFSLILLHFTVRFDRLIRYSFFVTWSITVYGVLSFKYLQHSNVLLI